MRYAFRALGHPQKCARARAHDFASFIFQSDTIAITTMKYYCDLRNRKYGLLTDLRGKNNGRRRGEASHVCFIKALLRLRVMKRPPDFAGRFIIS